MINVNTIKLGVIALCVVIISGICVIKWRRAVLLVFLWMGIEDLIRKLTPGNPIAIFLLKDFALGCIYVGYFYECHIKRRIKWKNPLTAPLLFLLGLAFVQIFNPRMPVSNPLVPLLGLKALFFYVPLMYIGYHIFRSGKELFKFSSILLVVSIPIVIFGLIQFNYGISTEEDRFSNDIFEMRSHSTSFGIVPQATSTFASAGRFSEYILLISMLSIGILASARARKIQFISYLSLCGALLGLILSTRRAAILAFFIAFLFVLYKTGNPFHLSGHDRISIGYSLKRRFPPLHILVTSAVLIIVLVLIIGAPESSMTFRYLRHTFFDRPGQEFSERVGRMMLPEIFFALKESYFIGHGLGTMTQGIVYVLGRDVVNRIGSVEAGLAYVLWELGLVGGVIFIWLYFKFLRAGYRASELMRNSRLYVLGVCILAYEIGMLIYSFKAHQTFNDAHVAIFRWFWIGVLLRLPNFNKNTKG